MKERIGEIYKMKKSLILVGSPRTLYEGQQVMPFLEKNLAKKYLYFMA